MKRILILVLVLTLLGIFLTACAGDKPREDGTAPSASVTEQPHRSRHAKGR